MFLCSKVSRNRLQKYGSSDDNCIFELNIKVSFFSFFYHCFGQYCESVWYINSVSWHVMLLGQRPCYGLHFNHLPGTQWVLSKSFIHWWTSQCVTGGSSKWDYSVEQMDMVIFIVEKSIYLLDKASLFIKRNKLFLWWETLSTGEK